MAAWGSVVDSADALPTVAAVTCARALNADRRHRADVFNLNLARNLRARER